MSIWFILLCYIFDIKVFSAVSFCGYFYGHCTLNKNENASFSHRPLKQTCTVEVEQIFEAFCEVGLTNF